MMMRLKPAKPLAEKKKRLSDEAATNTRRRAWIELSGTALSGEAGGAGGGVGGCLPGRDRTVDPGGHRCHAN